MRGMELENDIKTLLSFCFFWKGELRESVACVNV